MVAAGAILISFSSVFMVISGVAPSTAAFYRTAVAVPPLLMMTLIFREMRWRGWKALGIMILAGLAYCLDLIFWHNSILLVGPGPATILTNFQVFIMAAFSIIILKTVISRRLLCSVPVAIAGLYLIFGLTWEGSSDWYHLGVLCGLLSAASYAVFLLLIRSVQAPGDWKGNISVLLVATTTTAFLSGIYSMGEGTDLAVPGINSWISLIAYGIICQFIAYILITDGLTRTDPMKAGLILLLQPAGAFIWDIVLFHLPVTLPSVTGAVLTLIAIYLGTSAGGRDPAFRPGEKDGAERR